MVSIENIKANATHSETTVSYTHLDVYKRQVYAEYRKSGYSKKFLETHREAIELHRAAKALSLIHI